MAKKQNKHNSAGDKIFNFVEKGINRFFDFVFKKSQFGVFPQGELSRIWHDIENMEPRLAIIEADKLVDTVLKRGGVGGTTMADRLRKAERVVDRKTYQDMWDAHKVRNQLVHEVYHDFEPDRAVEVLWKMKRFLVSIGAFKNE